MAQSIPKELFSKVEALAQQVKTDLQRKGLVVPIKNSDGTINLGTFKIIHKDHAFYVVDRREEIIVGPVNLAQTAILVANDLALGRIVDDTLINSDRWFGWKSFDEESYQRSARINIKKHNIEQAEIFLTRAEIAKQQKNQWKRTVVDKFERLRKVK